MDNSGVVFISVIIPVYNVEKYLKNCLESVINQTFSEIELICVNDGSTDRSLEILEEYRKKDKRIVVLNQENKGSSGARNAGMRVAKGKYIYFMDSDDMLVKTAFEKLYNISENYFLDFIFFSPQILIDDMNNQKNQKIGSYFDKKNDYVGIKTGRELFCEMQENNELTFVCWLCFFNRNFLEKNNIIFYEGIIYEDNIFLIECFMLAQKTKYMSEKLYIYRIRNDSLMTSKESVFSLKSRLICIDETLRIFYTFCLDNITKKYLSQVIRMFLQNANNIRRKLDEILPYDKSVQMKYISDTLYKGAGFNENNSKNKLELLGFELLIDKSQSIILYGAGEIGNSVYRLIKILGCEKKIKCFAISDEEFMGNTIKNTPVFKFSKIDILESDLVILSVGQELQDEMLKTIIGRKIENFEIITRSLYLMIKEKVDSNI